MSARFRVQAGYLLTPHSVVDRKTSDTVAYCNDVPWAEMIADGLNMIVDQVDAVVAEHEEQKAIGWHDEPLSSL